MNIDIFKNNIHALGEIAPDSAQRISDSDMACVSMSTAKNGSPTCKFSASGDEITVHSIYNPEREAAGYVKNGYGESASTIFILGLGLGYTLLEIAKIRKLEQKVVVIERNIGLVRAAFESFDLSEIIASVRPVFLIGDQPDDANAMLREMMGESFCIIETPSLVRLDKAYYQSLSLLQLPSFAEYAPAQETKRILLFTGDGMLVPRLIEDVRDAMNDFGAETVVVNMKRLPDTVGLSDEMKIQMQKIVKDFHPSFILAVDGGCFREDPEFYAELKTPVIAWFVDNPFYILEQRHVIPNLMVLTWDRWYEDPLRRFGFKRVGWLPLGTNPKQFHPSRLSDDDAKKYESDISFVGDSILGNVWRDAILTIEDDRFAELFEGIIEDLTNDYTPGARYLLLTREKELGRAFGGVDRDRLCEMIEEEATGRFRRSVVLALSRFSPHVYGDENWKTVLPPNCVFRGRASYHGELRKIYAASRISINATKTQLPTTVNQRVFDVPASGGFVLTDYRPDLEILFDISTEVAVYRTLDELKEKADRYLNYTEGRDMIAEAAHRRVMAEHTWLHRVRTMMRLFDEWR